MGRILGIDYGSRRVGIAQSDPTGTIALPLKTLAVESDDDAERQIVALCAELKPDAVVLGLPLNMNGSHGPQAQRVEAFAERLRAAAARPVHLVDERLSSSFVERALIEADVSRAKRKGVIDKLAAQSILQGYLDARTPFAGPPDDHD